MDLEQFYTKERINDEKNRNKAIETEQRRSRKTLQIALLGLLNRSLVTFEQGRRCAQANS